MTTLGASRGGVIRLLFAALRFPRLITEARAEGPGHSSLEVEAQRKLRLIFRQQPGREAARSRDLGAEILDLLLRRKGLPLGCRLLARLGVVMLL
ncbi:MAG TPA: hypothetical protein VF178_11715 [Gemmatimonadaceae bacterium]